jgi:putative FmdB family regulatory protein
MPIYEYECASCGRYEVMQKITEEPLKKCEKCGRRVHRLVSLSSFALVGGGWGKDLYGSSSGSKTTTSTSPAPAAPATPATTKSEPKPAKTEPKKADKPAAAA